MHTWFECKIKYEKTGEDGRLVTVSENYLVQAMSHSDAESRIIEEMKAFISGEFTVEKVAIKKFREIIDKEDADRWFTSFYRRK